MRKKIARLNEIIGKGAWMARPKLMTRRMMNQKGHNTRKGRHPSIKHSLGHTTGAKTNGRRIVNGYECVQFERKGRIGVE